MDITSSAPQTPASAPLPPTAVLHRSRTDHQVAGICGALAPRLGIDVTLLRVLVVVLAVLGVGTVVVAYAACWILMPLESEPARPAVVRPLPAA